MEYDKTKQTIRFKKENYLKVFSAKFEWHLLNRRIEGHTDISYLYGSFTTVKEDLD